jgi:hypothetical protein
LTNRETCEKYSLLPNFGTVSGIIKFLPKELVNKDHNERKDKKFAEKKKRCHAFP